MASSSLFNIYDGSTSLLGRFGTSSSNATEEYYSVIFDKQRKSIWVQNTEYGRYTHWDDIAGKPSTFPVATHNHDDRYLKLSGGTMSGSITLNGNPIVFGKSGSNAILNYSSSYPKYGIWYHDDDVDKMTFSASGNADSISGADLAINGAGDGTVTIRGNVILNAGNYTTYTVTKAGAGATGNWGINITGNASTATNLQGGSTGAIAYQTAAGSTDYVSAGSNGQVLKYDGTNNRPYWGSDNNSDTKNTTGSNNKASTKLYLVGAETQGDNPITYSNVNVYIGTDNCLYSNGEKVITSHQSLSAYAKKDGSNAEGNWAINITGNAATATNATNATTATNLANNPSLQAGTSDTNKITVTAGGKTSGEFTVPYATNANALNNNGVNDPASAYENLKLKWFTLSSTVSGSEGYAGNNYGFHVSNNANGILWLGTHTGNYGHQLGFSSDGDIYDRYISSGSFPTTANGGSWKKIINSSNYTDYTVKKDGTGASGTWGISISGNAATATKWQNARTLTIGNTGKSVDGSGNVSWTLSEIGAASSGHNHDTVYVKKSGDTMTGALTIKGITASGQTSQGGFNTNYANIILQGDNTYGVSGIVFKSMKANDTSINTPSDVAFIQYHPYGVTAAAYNTNPTEASSGERSRLVIGIGNDADEGSSGVGEELWLQTAGYNDLKHYVVNTGYTILDAHNYNSYSPTLIGAGATGNWGINITGNAATATKSTKLAGGAAGSIPYQSAADTTTFVSIGSTGQILSIENGVPTWKDNSSTGIVEITKSLTVTESWMDTGIKSGDSDSATNATLSPGTWIVQIIHANLNSGSDSYAAVYSGVMSIYHTTSSDAEADSDEIVLHRSGKAGGKRLYLRTIPTISSNGWSKLQIAASAAFSTAGSITFKFKKIIS